jgi:large subunit ribosomal protein L9
MKVVLRSDVDGVGRRGDIVEVAGGFARNFLLPQGRAIVANDGVTSQAAAMRKARDLKEARDLESAQAQAAALAGKVVTLTARAGSGGRLFGSVTTADVAAGVLEQTGVEIDRRHIELDEPIKVVGTREVPVSLFGGVTTTLTVDVVAGD